MRIAFFDTKPYDKPFFDKYGKQHGITFKYFEAKLNEDTVDLANGYDGVCAFVNDTVNAAVIDRLAGLTGFDLYGKTVGVIGTGRIGRVFIDICRGFGMKVLAYDKFPAPGLDNGDSIRYVELDELFANSDIISLHCPLTDDTYHMIDATALAKCKQGVVILNTSRGALVDAESLLAGIKSRKVGAACLDVYEEEADVFFEDNSGHIMEDEVLARLISMPNVIVTSHQAFLTEEALENIAEITVNNIVSFVKNGQCANELCYRQGGAQDCKDGKCFE